jgi:predicted nucleic acid-binding protein
MTVERVYLDTTVPSAYFDDRAPDRLRLTREFWANRLPGFGATVSDLVAAEIAETPDEERRAKMLALVQDIAIVAVTPEAETLAEEYVARGIFPEKYSSDALHVALATVEGIPNVVSWNFEHLVKLRTRREVNLVNALKGYMPVEILAPPEL